MKKILITGKNSYVGMSVKKYLEQWPSKYALEELDTKGDAWKKFDFSKYDTIFHVAGIAHVDTKKVDEKTKKLYYAVNTDLAIEAAQHAKKQGVKLFIYMSSAIIYGDSAPIGKEKIITCDTEPSPANFYGDSKLQAEIGLRKLEDKNFKVAIMRPPMIYGENCKGNYQTLRKLALKLPLFPKINNKRSMIYIKNFAACIKKVVDDGKGGTYLPSNPDMLSTSDIVKTIAECHHKKIHLVPGCKWLLKAMSHFSPLVNKAFGSLAYDASTIAIDGYDYTTVTSIKEMEQ